VTAETNLDVFRKVSKFTGEVRTIGGWPLWFLRALGCRRIKVIATLSFPIVAGKEANKSLIGSDRVCRCEVRILRGSVSPYSCWPS
jgi:hypothetical protein